MGKSGEIRAGVYPTKPTLTSKFDWSGKLWSPGYFRSLTQGPVSAVPSPTSHQPTCL
jgi:hypothetical protein